MKDHENIHLKVQDLCDCFSSTDPLKEMAAITGEKNSSEAALKWIALTALHGINANAEKITLKADKDGQIKVVAEYRKTELPSPGRDIGKAVFKAIREITHIQGEKGKTQLALGIRDSSLDLHVKLKEKKDKRELDIAFP